MRCWGRGAAPLAGLWIIVSVVVFGGGGGGSKPAWPAGQRQGLRQLPPRCAPSCARRWQILNPASMKQALVEGAVRLKDLNLFEQVGLGCVRQFHRVPRIRVDGRPALPVPAAAPPRAR